MNKIHILNCILLILEAIGGFLIGGFFGGLITGACFVTFLFASLSKWLAGQALSKIDKNISDRILYP